MRSETLDIVWFGHQAWDVTWTSKQQMMVRLADRGHRVLYIDPRSSEQPPRPEPVRERIWRVDGEAAGGGAISQRVGRLTRPVRAANTLGFDRPVVITSRPQSRWLHRPLRPRVLAYYCPDDWTAFGGMSHALRRRFRRQENALLREMDLAIGVSPRLTRRFASICRSARHLPNAVEQTFAPERLAKTPPHPAMADLPRPRLLYMGQLDDRIDLDLLTAIARQRPEWQLVFAGRVRSDVASAGLATLPNVHLLGYVPHGDLGGVLREADVCLAPYRLTALTQACNPLKVYEYVGAGLPTVATPTDGLTLGTDLVRQASGLPAWIEEIERALHESPEDARKRAAAVRQHNWDTRTDDLERWLLDAAGQEPRPRRNVSLPVAGDAKDLAELDLRVPHPHEGLRYRLQRGAVQLAAATGPRAQGHRILVVRLGVLGDLIACLPMLRALRRGHPEAHIALGVGNPGLARAIFDQPGLVDQIIDLRPLRAPERRERLSAEWRLLRQRFDTVIGTEFYAQLPNALRCGARRRIAMADGRPVSTLSSQLVGVHPDRHESENCLHLAEAADGYATEADRVPTLDADVPDGDWRALAEQLDLDVDVPLVVVHVGGSRPSRRWPAERFGRLMGRLLHEREVQVVLSGVSDEAELCAAARQHTPIAVRGRVRDLSGQTTLGQLRTLLGRAALCVSNDTGVMHLARAIGSPLVALLGPENDLRWGPHPMGPGRCIALRHATPCGPCNRYRCGEHYCMDRLAVDEVLSAARELLDEPEAGGVRMAEMDRPVYRLERRVRHTTWTALETAGLRVPGVTAAVFVDATTLDEQLQRSVNSLIRQDYPTFRLAVLDTRPTGSLPADLPVDPSLVIRESDAAAGWAMLQDRCRGDWLVGVRGGTAVQPGATSAQVAALVRCPDAASAGSDGRVVRPEHDPQEAPWQDGRLRRGLPLHGMGGRISAIAPDPVSADASGKGVLP